MEMIVFGTFAIKSNSITIYQKKHPATMNGVLALLPCRLKMVNFQLFERLN